MSPSEPAFNFTVTLAASEPPASVLPVAGAGEPELMVDEQGTPVFPVTASRQRMQLEELAGIFGGELQEAVAVDASSSSRAATGHVVGIGAIERETRLYAHLTCRSWEVVESAADVMASTSPDVVLSASPRLDPQLIEILLMEVPHEITTGVVWGRTRAELELQVLLRAGSARLNGPLQHRRLDFFGAGLYPAGPARYRRIDKRTAPQEMRAALSDGVGVLTLEAHGDGIAVLLNRQLVICGMDRPASDADPDLAPACVRTGYCHNVDAPVREAIELKRLMPPESLAARVLVMASCQAAFVGSRALDSAWSPFARLATSPRIGAVIASPEMRLGSYDSLSEDLCDELAAGVPVGRALARYNQTPTVSENGCRLLLFGDPRTRAAPQDRVALIAHTNRSHQMAAHTRQSHERTASSRWEDETARLRDLSRYLRYDMRESGRVTSARALEAVERYESAIYAQESAESSCETMRLAVLDHLQTLKARTHDAWMGVAHITRQRTLQPCPQCRWSVYPYLARFGSGHERTLLSCPRCGFVVDESQPGRLRVDATDGTVTISGMLPRREWSAAVYLVPTRASAAKMRYWPSDRDDGPVTQLTIPAEEWPDGPVTVEFVVIEKTELRAVAAVTRAPSERCVTGV
jgi:hypothetical protein